MGNGLANAIVGVGSSIIGAGASIHGSNKDLQAVRETNAANLELAKYQNDWNLQQWNRENEYNSPLEQMKRLEAAGLNPNLVYGNGATTLSASSPRAADMKMEPYTGSCKSRWRCCRSYFCWSSSW